MVDIFLPQEMFNTDVTKLKFGSGVYMDILDTIAGLLLRNDVVGTTNENGQWDSNFKYEWEDRRNDTGEVVRGNCNTSESFRLCQEEVRRLYPHLEVYPLYVVVSMDKTEMGKFCKTCSFLLRTCVFLTSSYIFVLSAKRSLIPLYVTLGNLTVQCMNGQYGSPLTGCCPQVPYSGRELEKLLEEYGDMGARSQGKREIAARLILRYFEQEFIDEVLTSVKNITARGEVIRLQVGAGPDARTELFYPQVVLCVTDNEGGNQVMCIKSTRCKKPCRCCTFKLTDICDTGNSVVVKTACLLLKCVCV